MKERVGLFKKWEDIDFKDAFKSLLKFVALVLINVVAIAAFFALYYQLEEWVGEVWGFIILFCFILVSTIIEHFKKKNKKEDDKKID